MTAVDYTVASTSIFLSFASFFSWTEKYATRLLPANLPGRQLFAYGAAASAPPNHTPTRACHQDTKHPEWQGLSTSTGHTGSGTRRFRSHATYRDNPHTTRRRTHTTGRYTTRYALYRSHLVPGGHMARVFQDRPNGWGVEATRFHGTNVVSCKIG